MNVVVSAGGDVVVVVLPEVIVALSEVRAVVSMVFRGYLFPLSLIVWAPYILLRGSDKSRKPGGVSSRAN